MSDTQTRVPNGWMGWLEERAGLSIFFELANSGGDVGLHAVQPLGRACDAARLDDGAKDVKIG